MSKRSTKKSDNLGSQFVDARSKLNLSLEDVSKQILINIKYLSAIESDNYSFFPARAFAVAYFKKYSKFLGINEPFPLEKNKKANSNQEVKIPSKKINNVLYFVTINIEKIILFSIFIFLIIILNFFNSPFNNTEPQTDIETLKPLNVNEIKVTDELVVEKPIPELVNKNNYLKLFFSGECWVEIYSVNKKPLVYKLYNKDDFLEIEIEKSFTLTIGNIDNVKGTYGPSDINFSNSANKLKVSTTIFNNE